MVAWRKRTQGSLPVTHHGQTEMVNAIALAMFRGWLTQEDAEKSWGWLEEDFAEGHLVRADILWRSDLNRALELSRAHTPAFGTRTLDVMHVACAIELQSRYFLTFDLKQQALARAVGLKIVQLKKEN